MLILLEDKRWSCAEFIDDVIDTARQIGDEIDNRDGIANAAYCYLFPNRCGSDPKEDVYGDKSDASKTNEDLNEETNK